MTSDDDYRRDLLTLISSLRTRGDRSFVSAPVLPMYPLVAGTSCRTSGGRRVYPPWLPKDWESGTHPSIDDVAAHLQWLDYEIRLALHLANSTRKHAELQDVFERHELPTLALRDARRLVSHLKASKEWSEPPELPGELLFHTPDDLAFAAKLLGMCREWLVEMIAADTEVTELRPSWNQKKRVLTLGGRIIKAFKRANAPCQFLVLQSFEESRWPEKIDDPLLQDGNDPHERVRNTAKALNENRVNKAIKFYADGRATGFRWELSREHV